MAAKDIGDFGAFEEVSSFEENHPQTRLEDTRDNPVEGNESNANVNGDHISGLASFHKAIDKASNQSRSNEVAAEVEGENFGDFGSFEKSPANDASEIHREDFRDFGDFREVPSVNAGERKQTAPIIPDTCLDESIRDMFQSVFKRSDTFQIDSNEEPVLPFDVTIRSVIVSFFLSIFSPCCPICLTGMSLCISLTNAQTKCNRIKALSKVQRACLQLKIS